MTQNGDKDVTGLFIIQSWESYAVNSATFCIESELLILCPTYSQAEDFLNKSVLRIYEYTFLKIGGFPGGSEGEASACNAGDQVSISELGRSPGEGNGNPLQNPCLENPMDRGVWWTIAHEVAKSWT